MRWHREFSDVIKRVTSAEDPGEYINVLRLGSLKSSGLECEIAK